MISVLHSDLVGIARHGPRTVLFSRAQLGSAPGADWFEREGRQLARGRGAARRIVDASGDLVIRHYFRGGFVGRWNRDHYLYAGLKGTRPWREFQLLMRASQLDLPAPVAVAAQIVRRGLFYGGDLAMQMIDGSETLSDSAACGFADVDWAAIGRCIADFHRHGFDHADLNAHNVLLQRNQVWIIDWDRGALRMPGAWQAQNLSRLERSLRKLFPMQMASGEGERAWLQLNRAYRA